MRLLLLTVLCTSLMAQSPEEWRVNKAPNGVDMAGLSASQQATVLDTMRSDGCPCGCQMKVAECRQKDPNCAYSRGLSTLVVKLVRQGKSSAEMKDELAKSPYSRARGTQLLDDPVAINIHGAPSKGPANARVTIVEFSDFQCPYCAVAIANANALVSLYPNDVKLVFKQFPLDSHPQARLAAEAALAANAQGKFWPMHDKLFANAHAINQINLLAWAKEMGLDLQKFNSDLQSRAYRKAVEADMNDGMNALVDATPTFFINGKRLNANLDPNTLKPIIEAELQGGKSAHTAPKPPQPGT